MKLRYMMMVVFLLVALTGCTNYDNGLGSDPINVTDDPDKVAIYFFWGDGCPHCADQEPFMEELEHSYPEVEVKSFETSKIPSNAELFQEVAAAYGTQARGVPATFIGDEFWVGFSDSMKDEMEAQVKYCIENSCPNPGDKLN